MTEAGKRPHPEQWRALDVICKYGGEKVVAGPPMERMCDDIMAMSDVQIAEAVAAERVRIRAGVKGLPQGKRTRRQRYTDEENNPRTDYSVPAIVLPDGRVQLPAVLRVIEGSS